MVDDPWKLRHGFLRAELEDNIDKHLGGHAAALLEDNEKELLLEKLEIQCLSLKMFTSCGWFFDDPAGIEPVQILRYAVKAIELFEESSGVNLREDFIHKIEKMRGLKDAGTR